MLSAYTCKIITYRSVNAIWNYVNRLIYSRDILFHKVLKLVLKHYNDCVKTSKY